MQWRRQRRITHVIGSSNHVLLLARYQDAPPGEEDEEEGLRNGFVKGKENDTGTHNFGRNPQSGHKPRRSGSTDGGYAGARHKDESSGSPSQPKVIFNEDEYTRITTPRQDMLFKKGYLSKKKPWTGNANTSATSSTTESQSASHSTADGSETTEDQQLLDRDCTTGEYPPMMDSGAQLGYGTFYDHVGGYYYEYPVMLVGPAPMHPAQMAPNVLAAMPCGPVPLRPIEWVNPAFVPKMPGQPYCMMNYEASQGTEGAALVEEGNESLLLPENSNGTCNESGTGSASCSDSVAGETEEQTATEAANATEEQQADEQTEEQTEEQAEEQYEDEPQAEEQPLENGGPFFDPMLMQQPVQVSHVIPVPQPYMYPGHYMFGPPMINVNGVTLQGGPMIRTTEFAAMSAACAKRRKKKKRRKQRRLAAGNTEDEEEGEYSSECDTGLPSSRLSWTACSTSSNRPLNPECQEFQLRQTVEFGTSQTEIPTSANNTPTSEKSSTMNQSSTLSSDAMSVDNEACNDGVSDDSKDRNDEPTESSKSDQQVMSTSTTLVEIKCESKSLEATDDSDNEANRLTNRLPDDGPAGPSMNETARDTTDREKLPSTTKVANNEAPSANELCERPSNEMNGRVLVNGKLDSDLNNEGVSTKVESRSSSPVCEEKTRSRSNTPKSVENAQVRDDQSRETLSSSRSSSNMNPKKYSAKGNKFVREPTPGPDLSNATDVENETNILDLTQSLETMNLSNDSKSESCDDKVCNYLSKEEVIEALNEDSGFESQTRLSDYPITEAVKEWLRREKSPDLFITSTVSMDCEEDEDDELDEEEPPKNLQGNPMPALSLNSGADNAALSRAASCGEFARISNVKNGQQEQQQQPEFNNGGISRKKKDAKKRSEERRRVARHVMDGKLDHEVMSSSDSCGQQEEVMNIARWKNPVRQQQQDAVGEVCEFTEKDSVAGMRVALSSRMDSKRVNVRRTKRQGKSYARDPTNNNETKKHVDDVDDENDEGIVEDKMNVRTFEKGEIVVSEEGKLLMTPVYEINLWNHQDASAVIKTVNKNETSKQVTEKRKDKSKRSSSDEEESASGIGSLDSIEEPDVLECWEAEIIEPVITPKRMLQSEGVSCEGEAAEDDTIEIEQEYVQKYYRLARESITSVDDISLKAADPSTSSRSVPNTYEQKEVPTYKKHAGDKNNVPIDEAFEVYESCYNGNAPFLTIDPKVFKSRTLYGQEGEHPIPCKAACCRIQ
ncbi:uncharacterized protein LOC108626552 isoform X2 [Ceratina calcarata]|uniref:Uncharacterized protein LOC108626552 isoform X2 n=1 Tax=Ceratina calcarata TaxID=156304 RepID=A0AAJ7J3C3_9HYME|nr:uncharacterized protein LOC108626552 isoform X2 [Ceratina calcarata]